MSALINEVWRQVGGEDRTRSHANQLRIAAEFGPAIQFVEQGRMAEISQLFASLNVTLASLGRTSEIGSQRLLDVQGQGRLDRRPAAGSDAGGADRRGRACPVRRSSAGADRDGHDGQRPRPDGGGGRRRSGPDLEQ